MNGTMNSIYKQYNEKISRVEREGRTVRGLLGLQRDSQMLPGPAGRSGGLTTSSDLARH